MRSANLKYQEAKGDNKIYSVSLYNDILLDNGWYFDTVVRGGYIDNTLTKNDDIAGFAKADYVNYGAGVQAEAGKHHSISDNGFFVEPFAVAAFSWISGQDYKTTNGITVKNNSANSFIVGAGLYGGYERKIYQKHCIFYARLNAMNDFAGEVQTTMHNNIGEKYSNKDKFNDFWIEYALGAAIYLMPHISLNAQLSAQNADVKVPINGSFSIRATF
jgi:outer membrane autotransporter protein